MRLLLVLSLGLTLVSVILGLRFFKIGEETRYFLNRMVIWLVIASVVFFLFYLEGGGR